jgi:hypothetical protein
MVEIPAVCNRCGSFYPSGFGFDPGGTGITVTWTTETRPINRPCPACGGNGRVLGGAWGIVENTIQLLQGPETTVSELERLAGVLREARDRGADLDEVRSTVEREFPGLGQRLSKLLVPRTPADLVAYITMILTVISMILLAKQDDRPVNVDVDQVINNITVEAPPPAAQPPERSPSGTANPSGERVKVGVKVSRNRPCPCGSGIKFKKCHGAGGETHYVGP